MKSASSSSEEEEGGGGAGWDILMSLPPDMLNNILARLPFEQLVRTCCLSHAWQRRWESVPNLHIWFSPRSTAVPDTRVLWRCAAPVRSFTARVRTPRAPHGFGGFPDLLMASEASHGFGGFPELLTLILNQVAFPSGGGAAQLQHLISSAPGLTELSLDDVKTSHFDDNDVAETCAIRAPNLRVLRVIMFFDNGCRLMEDLPLLEEAAISIDDLIETPHYIDTFRRISNVNCLLIGTYLNQTIENPLQGISCKFQNLRTGYLTVHFGKLPSIMSIFSLLRFAPCIEQLHIEVEMTKRDDENDEDFETDDESESDDYIDEDVLKAEISDDLFANLKHVSLDGIKCLPNDIWFMKFMLSKTRLLESFFVAFRISTNKQSLCGCV